MYLRVGSLAEEESFLQNIIRKYIFGLNRPVPSSIDKEPEPKEPAPVKERMSEVPDPRSTEEAPKLKEPTQFDTSGTMSPEVSQLDKSFSGKGFVPPRRKPHERKYSPEKMAEQYMRFHNPSTKRPLKYYENAFRDKKFTPKEGSNLGNLIKMAVEDFKAPFKLRGMDVEQLPQYWEKMTAIESTSGRDKKGKVARGPLQIHTDTMKKEAKKPEKFIETYNAYGNRRGLGISGEELIDLVKTSPDKFANLMEKNDEVSLAVALTLYVIKTNPRMPAHKPSFARPD